MESSSSEITPEAEVEAAYLEFTTRREAEPGLSIERFVHEHPALADGLRGLHAAWSWFEDVRTPAGEAPPTPGQPYRVEDEIARGGMGVVYSVWDERLRRRLAMKVSRATGGSSGSADSPGRLAVARFVDEAQITAQLDHPGVVPVHDMGTDDAGRRFFTMRRVEGRTLDEVFALANGNGANARDWTRTRALGVLVQVCETIAFAHSRGVVHRDLKPSNVMIGRFGEVYVMDWGLAKVIGREVESDRSEALRLEADDALATFDGAVVGTPAYMAPEQASGEARVAGPEVDVYALGAILYHLLTGGPPYAGERDALRVLAAVRAGPPRPVDERRRDLPAELVAICERAMSRDARRRYPRAEALRDDLRAFLEDRVVRAHRTGAVAELKKWVTRNRGLASSFGVLLLVILGALVLQVRSNRDVRASADEANRRSQEARFGSYVANIAAAAKALDLGDAAYARRRLEACPEEERHFEWNHLMSRLDASIGVREYGEPLYRVDVRRSGGSALITFGDGRLAVSGPGEAEVFLAPSHTGSVRTAVWGVDGKVVAAGRAGWLERLDPESGEVLASAPEGALVEDLALHPTSERLAVGRSDGDVELRDPRTLEELARYSTGNGQLFRVAWSPSGGELAAMSGTGQLTVWDVEAGTELWRIDASADLGPVPAEWARVTFGPRGELVFVGRVDGSIGAFERGTGRLAFVLAGHAGRVLDLLVDAEANTLLSCSSDLSVAVWDLGTRRLRDRMPGHVEVPVDLSRGPEAGTAVTVAIDGTMRTWRTGGRRELEVLEGHTGVAFTARPAPDGRVIASGAKDATVRIWDVERRAPLRTFGSFVSHTRPIFGPDPGVVFVSDGTDGVSAIDASTGERRATMGQPPYHTDRLAACPTGRWVAALGSGVVQLFSVAGGEARARREGRYGGGLSFSHDGARLLVGSGDGTIEVLTVPELESWRTLERHLGALRSVAVSPDGELWSSGSTDGVIKFWDARTGRCTRTLEAHNGSVRGLAFSPDGVRLASCSEDKTVLLWDVARGESVLSLNGHTGWVLDVAFAPDGSWITSASEDATVRVWDTRPVRDLLR